MIFDAYYILDFLISIYRFLLMLKIVKTSKWRLYEEQSPSPTFERQSWHLEFYNMRTKKQLHLSSEEN